jgi:hypothetical protein
MSTTTTTPHTHETMKTPRQINKFKAPRQIIQEKDQFGCVGFISYGFIQYSDGSIVHVRNPDFNWDNLA